MPERRREKRGTEREREGERGREDGEERGRRTEKGRCSGGQNIKYLLCLTLKGNIGHVPTALNVGFASRRSLGAQK